MAMCDKCEYNIDIDCIKDKMSYPNAVSCNSFKMAHRGYSGAVVPIYTAPQTKWEIMNTANPPKCVFVADLSY